MEDLTGDRHVSGRQDGYDQALRVMQALAEGRNPCSGENVDSSHFIHLPEVVNGLLLATAVLKEHVERRNRKAGAAPNAGRAWTAEEDAALASEFDRGTSLRDLAARHGRSASAIEARLVRLEKIDANDFQPTFSLRPKRPA